jgi:TRAP-type uncharacterized transport system substrate-binding protein
MEGGIMEIFERVWITLAVLLCLALTAVLAVMLIAIGASAWTYCCDGSRDEITMATGPEGLAYLNYGKRYKDELQDSVDVNPIPTHGSPDNLKKLLDPKGPTRVALVQGDTIIDASQAQALESLGTVFYDTLWLFRTREEDSPPQKGINGLRGRRIAIGPNDSGTQNLALKLLGRHRISDQTATLLRLETHEARIRLQADNNDANKIDAAFFAASWDAEDVQELRNDPNVELVGYPQADAYAAFYPYLHKVVLHRGARDFAGDQPPDDLPLIATKASLIIRKDLPRRIQYRLLDAARKIHAEPVIQLGDDKFPSAETNKFPSSGTTGVPLSAAAQEFYVGGVFYNLNRFLADHLPRLIAEPIINVLLKVLIVIGALGILTPLVRLVPVLINWLRQRPVLRLLVKVMGLEEDLNTPDVRDRAGELTRQLKALEQEAKELLHSARTRGVASVAGSPAAAVLVMLLEERINALRQQLQRYTERGPEETAPSAAS